jgi:hypothetical protein
MKLRAGVDPEQFVEQAMFAFETVLAQFGTGEPIATERYKALQATRASVAGLAKLVFFGTCELHGDELDRHGSCGKCRRAEVEAFMGTPISDADWEQEERASREIDEGLHA